MLNAINRKLLVSVYNAQEVREGILGGGRIIDSEDPKSALGNISPNRIMDISRAVLDYQRNQEVQLSTNIGEDQLIFRRSGSGRAIAKSTDEMAGKAAQAALGVAISMGNRVHPCSIVKVGLDGMASEQLSAVLAEVVKTLKRAPGMGEVQVMSVLFAQDLVEWDKRKKATKVRAELVGLREFSPVTRRTSADRDCIFNLTECWDSLGLKDEQGKPLARSENPAQNLKVLIKAGILPDDVTDDLVVLNELFPHFGGDGREQGEERRKTNIADIKRMVDLSAEAGADAMMIDTSILSKVSNICLIDTSSEPMAHLSPYLTKNDQVQKGILGLAELQFFVDYCHHKRIIPNLAGSLDSIQAQQLWALLPELDQLSTRSAASAVVLEPVGPGQASSAPSADTRKDRVIVRQLVAGLAPPEHGGVLNLPKALLDHPEFKKDPREALKLLDLLRDSRKRAELPPLRAYSVDGQGKQAELDEHALRAPPEVQPQATN